MAARAPEVSIVMPAFNVETFVEEAVASVREQEYAAFELIAIDDGSTDATPGLLDRLAAEWRQGGLQLTVVHQPNRGAAAARNTGLNAASGSWIAFLDADDRWHPRLLARLVAELESNPRLDLVFPQYRYIDVEGNSLGIESRCAKQRFTIRDLLLNNPLHTASGTLLRQSSASAVGLFDETLQGCIDLDYWVRLAALSEGQIGCVQEVLVDYRRRDGQITSDWRRMESNWSRVFEKAARACAEQVIPIADEARARQSVYWSTIAYVNGDYAAARRLIATAWRLSPRMLAGERHAYVRAAACLASLLPSGMHARLRTGFNTLRARFGFDFS
jgi:glycosyltransferase involved in cell wall biosynthesis